MNRRSFFKFLGIGAATAAVAPQVIAEAIKESKYPGMSGTPINMEPFRPKTYQDYIGYFECTYAPYDGPSQSYTWKNPSDPAQEYNDMMENLVVQIDNLLKVNA